MLGSAAANDTNVVERSTVAILNRLEVEMSDCEVHLAIVEAVD